MKSVKCSQSFINDNTITYRPHKRKSTRPFARYTKEAYICLPKKQKAYRDWETDRKSTRLNSSHITRTRMPSSA